MGQKVNPVGLRLGINRTWDSRWFADGQDYGKLLHEDLKVRRALKKRLYQAGVSRIVIERPHKKCRITIYAARPGVIIGKKGADIDKLRKDIAAMTDGEVHLNIVEIRKPETDAQLVAENNHNLDIDSLVVAEAFVGKNLVMKRFHARARGRASRIEKPFSEITIVVRELGEAA